MGVTVTSGQSASGPTRRTVITQNVATAGTPLTTTDATLLPAQDDTGMRKRSLYVHWTGDQTLGLKIQYDLGDGLQTVATFNFGAGNVTPQLALAFENTGTSDASGTSIIGGTQPTKTIAGSWSYLGTPSWQIGMLAAAGGTTTTGALTVCLMEST